MSRAARLRRRIGRRGAFLGFLAILDIIYGYFITRPPAGIPPQPYPVFPAVVWGAWWLLTGAACTAGMLMKVDRVPYNMAALIKTAWGLRFAYLWYTGVQYAWVSMVIWLCFAAVVLVISGWAEEVSLPPEAGRGR